MQPSEVRRRVLEDHERIRQLLDEVEGLTRRFESGEQDAGPALVEKGLLLHETFCRHLDLEDDILARALREADAWGEERAARLAREHREQRELLSYLMSRLRDESRPTVLVARELKNFAELMREDMEQEESEALSDEVLRDDVITGDTQSG